MLRRLVFLAAMLPMAASADRPPAPIPVGLPVPDGPAQTCNADVALKNGDSVTTIFMTIGIDGRAADLRVVSPGPIPALDDAALTCLKHWRYKPATIGGVPTAMAWRTTFYWRSSTPDGATSTVDGPLPPGATPSPPERGKTHACSDQYPLMEIRLNHEGTATLAFNVTTEGRVSDIALVRSSGYTALDLAAAECASWWRYKPATKDGKPVQVPWQAQVQWVLPHDKAPAPATAPPKP